MCVLVCVPTCCSVSVCTDLTCPLGPSPGGGGSGGCRPGGGGTRTTCRARWCWGPPGGRPPPPPRAGTPAPWSGGGGPTKDLLGADRGPTSTQPKRVYGPLTSSRTLLAIFQKHFFLQSTESTIHQEMCYLFSL